MRDVAERHGRLAVLELRAWRALLLVAVSSGVGLAALTLSPVRPGADAFGITLGFALVGAAAVAS